MENNGWIRLHRKIMENKYWLSEPFTRVQAWIDLLLLANHKPGQIRKRGILIDVNRGQVGYSEESLAARWRWSRGKVLRFLAELKTGQQIERIPVQQNPRLSSLISIVNYDFYQSGDTTNEQKTEQQAVQQTDNKRYRNKNNKNEKNNNISPDAAEVLAYLNERTGKRYRNASHIQARLNDGQTIEDCKRVIDNKTIDPYFVANPKYLNPETLFRPSNFDKYVNEFPSPNSNKTKSMEKVSTCPRCRAQIPPQDRIGEGCIHCENKKAVTA